MNNNMYPGFPNNTVLTQGATQPPIQNIQTPPTLPNMNMNVAPQPPYAENLLQQNIGKVATIYMSYSDSVEWRDRIFTGVIEDAGRDYVLLSDPKTGKWTILWTVYLNFVEFDEPINHR